MFKSGSTERLKVVCAFELDVPLATAQHEDPGGLWAHPEAADLAPQTAPWPGQYASSTPLKTFGCFVPAVSDISMAMVTVHDNDMVMKKIMVIVMIMELL